MSDQLGPLDTFAGILSRITPEDGAIDGRLRDDWLEICGRAAEQALAVAPEIRKRVKREYPGSSWRRERESEAIMHDAIRIRSTLL